MSECVYVCVCEWERLCIGRRCVKERECRTFARERFSSYALEERFRFSFHFFFEGLFACLKEGLRGPFEHSRAWCNCGAVLSIYPPPPSVVPEAAPPPGAHLQHRQHPRLDPTKYLESTLFPLLISFSVLCQEVSHCPQQHTSDIKNYLDIVERYQESVERFRKSKYRVSPGTSVSFNH
jgi:hypothetical protein